jgi:voltage-gated potassium channel
MTTQSRLERFERRTEWPLAAIAIAFLGLYSVQVLAPKIASFGDAVWWAVTTVTTVGYGDLAPVTAMGRVVAVALMIGGITLVGTVTATLASWIVQRVAEEDTAHEAATRAQIDELREEIRRLSNLLTEDREPAYGEAREAL